MKFSINQAAFRDALTPLASICSGKTTIPVLAFVLLETQGEHLRLSATDLDVSLTLPVLANITEPGAVALPAKKLLDIVKSLPDRDVTIVVNDDAATLTCEKSKFRIPGLGKDNFPQMQELPTTPGVVVPAKVITAGISRIAFAITREESRYALNGGRLEITPTNLRLVATDGHRLAMADAPGSYDVAENLTNLIPSKALTEFGKLCERLSEVRVWVMDNHFFAHADGLTFSSRLLSGQFPQYELVLPKDARQPITLNSTAFALALRRVGLMADDRSHAIKIHLSPNALKIEASAADVGEGNDTLDIAYDGPEMTCGFNVQYLLDFLALAEGDVTMAIKDSDSQVELNTVVEGKNWRYVLMPQRL